MNRRRHASAAAAAEQGVAFTAGHASLLEWEAAESQRGRRRRNWSFPPGGIGENYALLLFYYTLVHFGTLGFIFGPVERDDHLLPRSSRRIAAASASRIVPRLFYREREREKRIIYSTYMAMSSIISIGRRQQTRISFNQVILHAAARKGSAAAQPAHSPSSITFNSWKQLKRKNGDRIEGKQLWWFAIVECAAERKGSPCNPAALSIVLFPSPPKGREREREREGRSHIKRLQHLLVPRSITISLYTVPRSQQQRAYSCQCSHNSPSLFLRRDRKSMLASLAIYLIAAE